MRVGECSQTPTTGLKTLKIGLPLLERSSGRRSSLHWNCFGGKKSLKTIKAPWSETYQIIDPPPTLMMEVGRKSDKNSLVTWFLVTAREKKIR